MTSCRYRIAVAAVCLGVLVLPAAAAPPEQGSGQAQGVAPAPAPPKRTGSWDSMGMRGFSVALVLGDLAGASTPDNLPAGAKKALSDMRDFLPYKSYRLLDTHWILCCSSAQLASVSGRLRGVEEDEYGFYIDVRPANEWTELAVRFNLRETAHATSEQAATTVSVTADRARQVSELAKELQEIEKRHSAGTATREQLEEMRRRVAELDRASQRSYVGQRGGSVRQVLDSTFTMKVGETVVIGTSRLKGDKALIALLTAAPKTTTPSR